MRFILAAAVLLLAPLNPLAARETIALTFDDLPALTQLRSQAYVNYANDIILRGLKRHHYPAIGFVNEGKFDDLDRAAQIENVRKWIDAGMAIGNHTYSHNSPNVLKWEGYVDDIERGERVIRPMLTERKKALRWFRHPYLETGAPAEEKDHIDHWLSVHGYRIAPVTMENSDWLFSEPYDDAIARHDEPRRLRVKAAYLEYTQKMFIWYQSAAHQLLGRDMAYVMLLHVTRLNADCFEDLVRLLKANKLHPVTLDKAMEDPAYKLPDHYAGAEGIGWLERWSPDLHKELPWDSFSEPPTEIATEYKHVDEDHR